MGRPLNALVGLLVAVGGLSAAAHAQTVYRPNDTFSTSNGNPNGVWSYGWKQADIANPFGVTGTFSTAGVTPGQSTGGVLIGWDYGGGTVAYNTTSLTQAISTVIFLPNELEIHPGSGTDLNTLRFTAPTDGLYALNASFYKIDTVGTDRSTRVDVVFNDLLTSGLPAYTTEVSGYRYTEGSVTGSYSSGNFFLTAGSTIDIQAALTNTGYAFNSTGIDLSITFTPVPEPPAVLAVVVAALAAVGCVRRRLHSALPSLGIPATATPQ